MAPEAPRYVLVLVLILLFMVGYFAWHRLVITRIAPTLAARMLKALDSRRPSNPASALSPTPAIVSRRAGLRGCFLSAAYETTVAIALSLPVLILVGILLGLAPH